MRNLLVSVILVNADLICPERSFRPSSSPELGQSMIEVHSYKMSFAIANNRSFFFLYVFAHLECSETKLWVQAPRVRKGLIVWLPAQVCLENITSNNICIVAFMNFKQSDTPWTAQSIVREFLLEFDLQPISIRCWCCRVAEILGRVSTLDPVAPFVRCASSGTACLPRKDFWRRPRSAWP